jgi:hypothetical protein
MATANSHRDHSYHDQEHGKRPGQRRWAVGHHAIWDFHGPEDAVPDRREEDDSEQRADDIVECGPVAGTEPLSQRRPLTCGRNVRDGAHIPTVTAIVGESVILQAYAATVRRGFRCWPRAARNVTLPGDDGLARALAL